MKQEDIDKYNKAAEEGTIRDADNPIFLFSGTSTKLLVKCLNKEFSFTDLAKRELTERGLNLKGEYVGFGKTEKAVQKSRRNKGTRLR